MVHIFFFLMECTNILFNFVKHTKFHVEYITNISNHKILYMMSLKRSLYEHGTQFYQPILTCGIIDLKELK